MAFLIARGGARNTAHLHSRLGHLTRTPESPAPPSRRLKNQQRERVSVTKQENEQIFLRTHADIFSAW